MKWRAWYTGGRTFDSVQHTWADLPAVGILFVVHYKDTGRTTHNGADWIWLHEGEFGRITSGDWGTDKERPTSERVSCASCIKQGVAAPDREFWAVVTAAMKARAP